MQSGLLLSGGEGSGFGGAANARPGPAAPSSSHSLRARRLGERCLHADGDARPGAPSVLVCLHRAAITSGLDLISKETGYVAVGEHVEALECVEYAGRTRVRCVGGGRTRMADLPASAEAGASAAVAGVTGLRRSSRSSRGQAAVRMEDAGSESEPSENGPEPVEGGG